MSNLVMRLTVMALKNYSKHKSISENSTENVD